MGAASRTPAHATGTPMSRHAVCSFIQHLTNRGATLMALEEYRANRDSDNTPKPATRASKVQGQRRQGNFTLIRMKGKKKDGKENWLLIKKKDAFARPDADGATPAPKAKSMKSAKANRAPAGGKHAAAAAPGAVEVTHPDKL